MNKEIYEMAEELSDDYCKQYDDGHSNWCMNVDCEVCRAERLYNAGYRKTVWHKIADGDLPKDKRDIVLYFELGDQIRSTATGYYDICVSNFVVYDFGAVRNQDVIAWTELPTYKGEQTK